MRPITNEFFLAFDHRNSYRRALPDADHNTLEQGKVLVAEALNRCAGESLDGTPALLTDLEYGQPALKAIDAPIATAVAIEKSGQNIFEVEDPAWLETIDRLAPTYAKVLIRYRADDPRDDRQAQIDALMEVQTSLTGRQTGFLLEIITPFTEAEKTAADSDLDAVRLPLLQDALAELLDAGLNPELWKVEGLNQAQSCQAVAEQCRRVRSDAGIVVLGAGAPAETVDRWLTASAAGGYSGFAIGRSIWSDPITDWATGRASAEETTDILCERYRGFVKAFSAATSPA